MRKLVMKLSGAVRWLTGEGAAANARFEVDRETKSVVELQTQLDRVPGRSPRRAA